MSIFHRIKLSRGLLPLEQPLFTSPAHLQTMMCGFPCDDFSWPAPIMADALPAAIPTKFTICCVSPRLKTCITRCFQTLGRWCEGVQTFSIVCSGEKHVIIQRAIDCQHQHNPCRSLRVLCEVFCSCHKERVDPQNRPCIQETQFQP